MAEKPSTKSAIVRAPADELDGLRAFAHAHGRSFAQELRLAVRLHLLAHSAAYLRTRVGELEVDALGLDLEGEREMVMRQLRKLTALAFAAPITPAAHLAKAPA